MAVTEQRRWRSPRAAAAAVLGLAIAAAGCGGGTPQTEGEQAGAEDHAAHEGQTAGGVSRVYFVQPRDGATVMSPVQFEFGSAQFSIMAVPEGELTAADVRPGVGHYHIGINADCLPAGEVIPQGNPTWVHFGRGNNTIEMPLEPGTYKFSVQAGDDLHRAVDGLCETITVTVAS